MTRIAERQQAAANATLLPEIRKLAMAGWYASQIAGRLGCTRERICGLIGQHGIQVMRKPRDSKAINLRYKTDPAPQPDISDLWAKQMAGQRYGDDDRAAPPMVFAIPRGRPASLTANSSMAWSA